MVAPIIRWKSLFNSTKHIHLEEAPEVLPQFYSTLLDHDVDVVFGVQEIRQDPFLNRMASAVQYTLVNVLTSHPIPRNLMTVRLMTSRFVRHLLEFREQVFVISMLWEMTGFKRIGIPVAKKFKGKSSYNFSTKVRYFVKTITTTSNKPLIYVVFLGLFITIVALLFIMYVFTRYYFYGIGVDGWTSLILSMWFLGGLNMFALGIIGTYIAVIFSEVKERPYTIVRQLYRRSMSDAILTGETYVKNTL